MILESNVCHKNVTGPGAENWESHRMHTCTLCTVYKLCNNLCKELTSRLKILLLGHFPLSVEWHSDL